MKKTIKISSPNFMSIWYFDNMMLLFLSWEIIHVMSVYWKNHSIVPICDSKEEQETFFPSPPHVTFYFLISLTSHSFKIMPQLLYCKIGRLFLYSLILFSTWPVTTPPGKLMVHMSFPHPVYYCSCTNPFLKPAKVSPSLCSCPWENIWRMHLHSSSL